MNRTAAFALLLAMIALGLATIAMLEAKETNNGLPLVHADFRSCMTIHNGPIQRPDHYSVRPRGRKADTA